jgi:translocation and assembly module TamB
MLARALGTALLFVSAALVAVALCLRLALARRLVMVNTNRALASLFVGRVTVDRVGRMGLTYVEGIDAHVDGADGSPVLRVEGLRARVSTWGLIRSALAAGGDVVVDLPELSFARVDVTLDPDDSGTLRIARAFQPRPSASPSNGPARTVRVALPRIRIAHGMVHIRTHVVPPCDAELNDAEGSLLLSAGKLAIELSRGPLVLRGLPGGVQALGDVEADIALPALRIHALWNGAVGTIRDRADLAYDDGRIDARLDVAPATADEMSAVWPECPLFATSEGHVEAHGVLPRVGVRAHAVIGAGTIDVSGPVVVSPELQATLHVEAHGFDAQTLRPGGPRSDLAVSGDVSVTARPTGAIEARGAVALGGGGSWGAARLPPATMTGDLSRSAAGELSARAELSILEPGAPAVVTARLAPKGGSPVVTFEAEARIPRLEDVRPLGHVVTGSANARATGTIDLGAGTVETHLSATLAHLGAREVSLRVARVEARASGKLVAPSIRVEVDGEWLETRGLRLAAVRAGADLRVNGGTTLEDVEIVVAGDGEPARARAALVRISGEGIRVDDAWVEGLGAPLAASVQASSSAVLVRARTAGIDLARLGSFANVPVKRGKLSFDVDASVSAGSAEGRLAMDLQDAALLGIDHASAQVEATLHGRLASGHATARIDDIATLELRSSSVRIGAGSLIGQSAWRRSWGSVEFDVQVHLAQLAARLPPKSLPFEELQGTLKVGGRIERDSANDVTPDVELTARTAGLVIVGRDSGGSPPWRIEQVDPTIHVTVDGETGDTVVETRLRDAAGLIAKLDAHSRAVPYAILFSDENPLSALSTTPFDAHLELPSRRLDSLRAFGVGDLGGELQASVSWRGAVVGPTIDVTATMIRGRADARVLAMSLDLSLGAHYEGAQLDATLQATGRKKNRVLDASARVHAKARDVLAGLAGATIPWTASARAKLDQLPLQSIVLLNDSQLRGHVSGEAMLEGLHADARANLALTFDGLQVGDVSGRSSTVKIAIDGHSLDATARLDQTDGFIEGRARVGTHWGSAVTPTLDLSQEAELSLSAKQFRAAFLFPLVSKWLTELDGRIDADARLQVSAGGGSMRPEGTIALRDGAFELPSFGGPFHAASATLALAPDGIVRLQDAMARGTTGSVQGAATARLDGLSLGSLRANVRVPANDPLPLVFDGVQLGAFDGGVDVTLNRAGGGVDVLVDVPVAHLQLPSGSSSLDVQPLGDVDGVKVGLRRRTGEFAEMPLGGVRGEWADAAAARRQPTQIAMRLGDVRVSRGTDLDVRIEGQPKITITDETRVSGQIRILRGSIDIQGKPFTIDSGTITFVGNDASNPQIVLTASWAAPDGATRVYADFVGPLKTGKVRLRSEPMRPQSEILALILFGTADVQTNSSSDTSARVSSAAVVAGGAATQPLNRALNNLGVGGGISTRIDTSQVNPRPEVEVQIARDISLQIAWVLGVPPLNSPDTALLTLDWRFLRKWALETTVGDSGTSILDLIWQHRY